TGEPTDVLERVRNVRRVLRARPPLRISDLAIGGAELRALGLAPGPRFGEILAALLEHVLERPEENRPEILEERVRQAHAREDP
ncbi:MAG: hypothetical protein M3409_02985, partial [Gemmatimonadota bacterium]|nr:hypothetical protein [Gemmatimonadota bacterium]